MAKIFDFFKRKPITLTGETTEEWIKMCKKEFNINNYKGKYVMHCKTEEEALDFCNYLHFLGKKWTTGDSYLSFTYWEKYKKDTCYNFNEECFHSFCYYQAREYTILEWENFMKKKEYYEKFNKPDLKNGDIVTYRNGVKGVVFLEFDAIMTHNFECYNFLKNTTYDLNDMYNNEWDIVKVQRAKYIHQFIIPRWNEAPVIWERQETVEMTLAEVCKALGKNVKIVKE